MKVLMFTLFSLIMTFALMRAVQYAAIVLLFSPICYLIWRKISKSIPSFKPAVTNATNDPPKRGRKIYYEG